MNSVPCAYFRSVAARGVLVLAVFATLPAPPSRGAVLLERWDKRFGGAGDDRARSILRDDDGYLVGGWSSSAAGGDKTEAGRGGWDFWIAKLGSNGSRLWDRRFGGAADDFLKCALRAADGGFLLGGSSASPSGGDKTQPSRGGWDFWIVKLDSSGGKLWDKRFGGAGDDVLECFVELSDGSLMLGGRSNSGTDGDKTEAGRGGWDFWILKLDSSGNKLWDRRFGGAADDSLHAIARTSDGGYVLGGYSTSEAGGDKTEPPRGGRDFWIVKTDADGNKLWDKRFGGADDDTLNDLIETTGGDLVLGGGAASGMGGDVTESGRGGWDFWTVKTDAGGNKLWDKRFGGAGWDELESLRQTTDGGFLLAGWSFSGQSGDRSETSRGKEDYWIVKTDSDGGKEWDRRFGSAESDTLASVVTAGDGRCAVAGSSDGAIGGEKSENSRGGQDFWILEAETADSIPPRRPVLEWTATPGANWYYLWINAGGTTFYQKWLKQDDAEWWADFDIKAGEYTWWVRPWSDSTGYGSWSSAFSFSIPLALPTKAALLAPGGAIATNSPQFLWIAAENATWHYLWVEKDGKRTLAQWYEQVTNCAPFGNLPLGSYRWWVRGWNTDGDGPWSDPMDFSYGRSSPLSPTGTVAGTRSPVFEWIPVVPATWYYLWINKGGAQYATRWISNAASLAWTEELGGGSYRWWVRTWNSAGDGPWSDPADFTIPTAVPQAVTLLSPTGSVAAGSIAYTWTADAAATWYQLWVNRGGGEWHVQWHHTGLTNDEVRVNVPDHPGGSAYTWWVRGWSPDGSGPWSEPAFFSCP